MHYDIQKITIFGYEHCLTKSEVTGRKLTLYKNQKNKISWEKRFKSVLNIFQGFQAYNNDNTIIQQSRLAFSRQPELDGPRKSDKI